MDTNDIREGFHDGSLSAFSVCRDGANRKYSGRIFECKLGLVVVDIKCTDIMTDIPYTMEFKNNRLPFLMQHEALKYVENHNLFGLLINNPRYQVNYKYCAKSNVETQQIITEYVCCQLF